MIVMPANNTMVIKRLWVGWPYTCKAPRVKEQESFA